MSYQRLQNVAWVRRRLARCLKERLLVDHRPGEVWYNHNEYPALPHRPIDESDAAQFDEYRRNGVEIKDLKILTIHRDADSAGDNNNFPDHLKI